MFCDRAWALNIFSRTTHQKVLSGDVGSVANKRDSGCVQPARVGGGGDEGPQDCL